MIVLNKIRLSPEGMNVYRSEKSGTKLREERNEEWQTHSHKFIFMLYFQLSSEYR
jgi:hypothetical protein